MSTPPRQSHSFHVFQLDANSFHTPSRRHHASSLETPPPFGRHSSFGTSPSRSLSPCSRDETPLTSQMSDVACWLTENGMSHLVAPLSAEGYTDIEDLVELTTDTALFLQHVPNSGHRSKMKRLLTPSRHRSDSESHSDSFVVTPRSSRSSVDRPFAVATRMKILVLGGRRCGKSSFVRRAFDDKFDAKARYELGGEFREKSITVGAMRVVLHFWDVCALDAHPNIARTAYKGSHGAIFMYDATRPETLSTALLWKTEIDKKVRCEHSGLPLPCTLLGSMCDLGKSASPLYDSVERSAFLNQHKFMAHEFVSAKTGEGIESSLEIFVSAVLRMNPMDLDHRNSAFSSSSGAAGGNGIGKVNIHPSRRHAKKKNPVCFR